MHRYGVASRPRLGHTASFSLLLYRATIGPADQGPVCAGLAMKDDSNNGGSRLKDKEVWLVGAGGALLGAVVGAYRGSGPWDIVAGAVGGAVLLIVIWQLGQMMQQGPR